MTAGLDASLIEKVPDHDTTITANPPWKRDVRHDTPEAAVNGHEQA